MSRPLLAPGVPVDLSNCDLEPIHIPSLLQPHGMLLAARLSDLRVVYTSDNAPLFLGLTPAYILKRTLPELLGEAAMAKIEEVLGKDQYVPKNIRTYKFPVGEDRLFDVSAHRANGLLCVELEPAASERHWDGLSTRLENAMRTLGEAKTLDALCFLTPILLRELTGYDRVMVYKFDADGNGEVVGEQRKPGMEAFLGLHYPATDIPSQARRLYLLQRVRTIVDVGYKAVPIVGNGDLIAGSPLDMTYCSLRSVSPIHIEYLQNMGVGATLAISVIQHGELWGMIVGHHETARHLPPETRALCDLIGQLVSLCIGVTERADAALAYRLRKEILDALRVSVEKDLADQNGLATSADALLKLVKASGAIVSLDGNMHLFGETPAPEEAQSLFLEFQVQIEGDTVSSENVGDLFPAFAHLASLASGALFVPLSGPTDGILWIRGEIGESVRWAGKIEVAKQPPSNLVRMSPRKSFALWEEEQAGRSRPWRPDQIAAALDFQRIAAIALLHQSQTKLLALKRTDTLTGLANRQALLERLAAWHEKAGQGSASLLFLDLDNFKDVNDRLGHAVGDELLKQVGSRLRLLGDGEHFAARLGGDEFAVFCENTDVHQAEMVALSILQLFVNPFVIMGAPLASTTSIGIAPVHEPFGARSSDPLRVADSAMYVAKHKGGNQFSTVESREQAEILRLTIEQQAGAKLLAAAALATSYEHMKAVMDSTSDGVIEVNPQWTVQYGNRRATEQLERFRVGRSFWSCFPSLRPSSTEIELREGLTLHKEVAFEHHDAFSDNWFRGKLFPTAGGASIFFNNITLEKKMQDQIAGDRLLREKRIEALGHMAGGLAHEISNPLAIIQGKANELRLLAAGDGSIDSAQVRVACETILKTSNRASNILRGLRGFVREGGQDPMTAASIYQMVEQCLEMQQTRFERNGVDIRVELDQDLPLVVCRQVQVEQILTNLINNAFDAITQSDSIERWMSIGAQCSQNTISICVTDSGPGVQEQFRAHLMEAFFTTKELGLGMGVGLSLSRAIALEHKGTLTMLAGSEHTAFLLTLPIAPDPLSSQPILLKEGCQLENQ